MSAMGRNDVVTLTIVAEEALILAKCDGARDESREWLIAGCDE